MAAEFSTGDAAVSRLVQANRGAIERFATLSELRIVPRGQWDAKGGAVRSTAAFDVRVAYTESVDPAAEKARLEKEIGGLARAIASKERQLADATFRSRAPEGIIKGLESTLAEQRVELEKLRKRLEDLGGERAA